MNTQGKDLRAPCLTTAKQQYGDAMDTYTGKTNVCGRDLNACLHTIEQFHGWKAPGLAVGMFMVDLAMALIGKGVEFDAIVESRHCLPDAVQLFTPCTVGNGWLKIVNWDKFAVTLYDRRSLTGCLIWLDFQKTKHHPLYHGWFMQTIHKKDIDHEMLLGTIIAAGRTVLSDTAVCMTSLYRRNKKGALGMLRLRRGLQRRAGGIVCSLPGERILLSSEGRSLPESRLSTK